VPSLRHHALTPTWYPLGRYAAAVARAGPSRRLEDDAVAMGEMVVPACPAGGLLLWDFRTLHRGMPNDTRRGAMHAPHDPRNKSRTLLVALCPLPHSQPCPPLSAAARPVAHAVLSTGLARDRLDVAQASLAKELAALPAEGAARDAARASIARLQAERWQKARASSAS
jgi:hypothetical protein